MADINPFNAVQMLAMLDPRIRDNGHIHHSLNFVSIVSTATTTLLTAPDGHTLWLFALVVLSRATANAFLLIGSASFTQRLPRLGPFINPHEETVWLPPTHFEATIQVRATVAAADPNDIQVTAYAFAVG